MAIYGFLLVGFCVGMGVGMLIMFISDTQHIKEIRQIGLEGIDEVGSKYMAELKKAYAEIKRLQGVINGLQIEKAKAAMESKLPKAPEIMPDWLKDFYDTSKVPEGKDDFGGITL